MALEFSRNSRHRGEATVHNVSLMNWSYEVCMVRCLPVIKAVQARSTIRADRSEGSCSEQGECGSRCPGTGNYHTLLNGGFERLLVAI
jgi:hypothetical protein